MNSRMKMVIFTPDKKLRLKDITLSNKVLDSILQGRRDTTLLKFLYENLVKTSRPVAANFVQHIAHSLGVNAPITNTTTECDSMIIQNIDKAFTLKEKDRFIESYIKMMFERYIKLFNSVRGAPIVIISDYDDIDRLPEEFTTYQVEEKTCYSLLPEYLTKRVYNTFYQSMAPSAV